jgi:TatD DNase family protein
MDCHCHVDDYAPETSWTEEQKAGLSAFLVTTTPQQYLECLQKNWPIEVNIGLGFFPLELQRHPEQIELFFDHLPLSPYLGELGLDFSDPASKDHQITFFDRLLNECKTLSPKVMSLHSRGSGPEVLERIKGFRRGSCIMHWYSGPSDDLDQLPTSCFFSINTAMLTSRNGKRLLKALAPERCLLESDGPYVQFEGRPAQPRDLCHVIDRLASLWGMSRENVQNQLNINTSRCFGVIENSL